MVLLPIKLRVCPHRSCSRYQTYRHTATRYFLSRLPRRLPSVPLTSAPLGQLCSSPELTTPPVFRALALRKWCSGIHSSWYPPAPVAVTVLSGAEMGAVFFCLD